MFSFRKGEPIGSSQHKAMLRAAARRSWPKLTRDDLMQANTEAQLSVLVGMRTGRTPADALVEVRRWMEKQNMRPDIGGGLLARRPISRWENEGGSVGFVDKSDV